MKSSQKFSQEVQSRAVGLLEGHREDYPSLAVALQSIAPKIGCTPKTLRVWVNQAAVEAGSRPGIPASDRHRASYGVEPICRVLQKAPSGYYRTMACRKHPEGRSQRARLGEKLLSAIRFGMGREPAGLWSRQGLA